MPSKEYSRTQRVADLLQQELARVLKKEIKDPRLQWVTISAVHISRDLAYAKIFITADASQEKNIEQLLVVLNKAAGFLRHQLAQSLDLRITPHLRFVHDTSIEYGAKMSALINAAIERDRPSSDKESD